MQAKISEDGDVVVIRLMGRVDMEAAAPFREACTARFAGRKVVFDFHELLFVGSTGIVPFLEVVQDFAESSASALGFSGVGSEFQRVIAATALGAVAVFDDAKGAAAALNRAPAPFAAAIAPRVHRDESIFIDRMTPAEEAALALQTSVEARNFNNDSSNKV